MPKLRSHVLGAYVGQGVPTAIHDFGHDRADLSSRFTGAELGSAQAATTQDEFQDLREIDNLKLFYFASNHGSHAEHAIRPSADTRVRVFYAMKFFRTVLQTGRNENPKH